MPPAPAPVVTTVYNIKSLSQRWQCSPSTVRGLIRRQTLKAVKLGHRTIVIELPEIERFETTQDFFDLASLVEIFKRLKQKRRP